jgi:hypothetical protein
MSTATRVHTLRATIARMHRCCRVTAGTLYVLVGWPLQLLLSISCIKVVSIALAQPFRFRWGSLRDVHVIHGSPRNAIKAMGSIGKSSPGIAPPRVRLGRILSIECGRQCYALGSGMVRWLSRSATISIWGSPLGVGSLRGRLAGRHCGTSSKNDG